MNTSHHCRYLYWCDLSHSWTDYRPRVDLKGSKCQPWWRNPLCYLPVNVAGWWEKAAATWPGLSKPPSPQACANHAVSRVNIFSFGKKAEWNVLRLVEQKILRRFWSLHLGPWSKIDTVLLILWGPRQSGCLKLRTTTSGIIQHMRLPWESQCLPSSVLRT